MSYNIVNVAHGFGSLPSMGLMCAYDSFLNISWTYDLRSDSNIAKNSYLLHRSWLACDIKNNTCISFWMPKYIFGAGNYYNYFDRTIINQYPEGYSYTSIDSKYGNGLSVYYNLKQIVNQPGYDKMYQDLRVF